jgi:GDP-L-fucose synthase
LSKIYIAGHTGLIGSACLRHFNSYGEHTIITRTRDQLDLHDSHAVDLFFQRERPSKVIFAAGVAGGIEMNVRQPAYLMTKNLNMHLPAMDAARRHGCEHFIVFGSSCMYPRNISQPMFEASLLSGKPEETSLPYALAKLSILQLALSCNVEDGVRRFIPVIPNSVFGPNDNFDTEKGHVLAALVRRFANAKQENLQNIELWGSGEPKREFVFSDEVAAALEHILFKAPDAVEGPINIGSGDEISISQLANKIAGLVGYSGTISWNTKKPDGAMQKLLSNTKISSTGWKTSISFDEALGKTIDWYLEHGVADAQ